LPNYGHGTHVSGIAAGNGLANGTHEGCAPKADLVVVALDFNKSGPTIADAVSYIYSKAFVLGKPCVINASVGDYYGSHDGTDLEAKLIESMVKNVPGRVLVAAAGNAGAVKFHVKTQPPAGDTSFTWIKNGSNLRYWCYADTNQIKNVQISIGANRTNYFNLGNIGFKNYNYGLSSLKTDTLKYNNNRIGIVKTSASINTYGVYELYVQIIADTTGLLWRIESKGNGLHHAWNFDFVNSPLPTVVQYPKITKYIMPDTMYSIVSSFQCLDDVITVANYVNLNSYYDVNNILQTTSEIAGGISATSSSGPTRDNKVKPDISATGANVFSAIALGMQASLISGAPQVVAQGSFHVQGGGTSAASPVVCGLAALYLQKYPSATSMQVKNAIINCAYSDAFTTGTLPNYRWGYGKLNGKGAMLCGIPTAINNVKTNEVVNYAPNPFTNKVKLSFESEITRLISVYSVDGKLVFTDTFSDFNYELNANKFMVDAKGLLFVKVQSDNNTTVFKLIRVQ
jgi:subtilisin family serine protease